MSTSARLVKLSNALLSLEKTARGEYSYAPVDATRHNELKKYIILKAGQGAWDSFVKKAPTLAKSTGGEKTEITFFGRMVDYLEDVLKVPSRKWPNEVHADLNQLALRI